MFNCIQPLKVVCLAPETSFDEDDETSDKFSFNMILKDELERVKDAVNLNNNTEAFTYWATELVDPEVSRIRSDPEKVADVSVGGAKEKWIDAAWYDPNDLVSDSAHSGTYFVACVECPDRFDEITRYDNTPVERLREAIEWLYAQEDPKHKGRKSNGVKYQFYKYCADERHFCKAVLILGGLPQDEDMRHQLKALENDFDRLHCDLYDINRLRERFIARLDNKELPSPKEVQFKILVKSAYEKPNSIAKALVAEVPLSEIERLYSDHGLSLFKKNLRGPLVRSPYNEGMQNTIEDPAEREKFWYYNNGITAICDGFQKKTTDSDNEETSTVTALHLQIVNGCQTCFTVHKSSLQWDNVDSGVLSRKSPSVMVRLIDISSVKDEDKRFDRKIARYTNSQTAVTDKDLHANDDEQIMSKVDFQEVGYFLETKRDEWKWKISEIGRRKIGTMYAPPYCFINEKVAQAFIAFWQLEPTFAKTKKNEIWTDETRYYSIFGTRGPALVLPMQLWHLVRLWNKKCGYSTRKRKKKQTALQKMKEDVANHGDLYFVSLFGYSFMRSWGASGPAGIQREKLKNCCLNLYEIIKRHDCEVGHLGEREVDKSMELALGILYSFSRKKCREFEELSVRNLLVKKSTWNDLQSELATEYLDEISEISMRSLGVLEKLPRVAL